jgi:hypothetical protein
MADEWVGNLIVNGSALQGTQWWDVQNASAASPGYDDNFCFQIESDGTMSQSADAEDWTIGAKRLRIEFYHTGDHAIDTIPDGTMQVHIQTDTSNDYITILINNTKGDWQGASAEYAVPKEAVIKQITFTIKANRMIILDALRCRKSFGVEQSVAEYIEQRMPVYLYAANSSPKSIGTIPVLVLGTNIKSQSPVNLQIGLVLVGTASVALILTAKFFLAGKQIPLKIRQACTVGYNTISANFIIPQVQPGAFRLDVQCDVNAGSFDIETDHATMYVMGAELEGGISSEIPFVLWQEKVPIVATIPGEGSDAYIEEPTSVVAAETINVVPIFLTESVSTQLTEG